MTPADPLIGSVLNDAYRIDRQLADGGMSMVYHAEQLSLNRSVVLKVLRPDFDDQDFIDLFLREARVNSQINHPNIVSVFDFGRAENGAVFLAMEYLEGSTLGDLVDAQQGLNLGKTVWAMEQICAGVHAAHKLNVVHRDLKPNNIMVSRVSGDSTIVKVLDFGISKPLSEGDLKHTQLGMVMGTPGYLSPEQISGVRDIDVRADIYALGAILYFLISGHKPYKGASIEVVMNRQLHRAPEPLDRDQLNDPAAIALAPVIMKAMSIDRNERYDDVKAFWQDMLKHADQHRKVHVDNESSVSPLATKYQFIFEGKLKADIDPNHVKSKLQEVLKFNDKHADVLFSGRKIVVRKNLSHKDAQRFHELFSKAGAIGHIEEMPTATRIITRRDDTPSLPHSLPSIGMTEALSIKDIAKAENKPPKSPQQVNSALDKQRSSFGKKRKPSRSKWIAVACVCLVVVAATSWTFKPIRYGIQDAWAQSFESYVQPRGVDKYTLNIGMSAAFSGSAREIGQSMRTGINAYFRSINENGGIHGRQLKLLDLDDGYEPDRALDNLETFLDKESGVFAMLGNVGTPTAKAILPKTLEQKIINFGTFSGASLLRKNPPDRYVFNYRASYADETSALIHYFVEVEKVSPANIAVFYQNDSYGQDGLSGVVNTLRDYGINEQQINKASYIRNTSQVKTAIAQFGADLESIQAIIIVGTYAASAAFINEAREHGYQGKFANVSFVGSRALVERLTEIGESSEGIIVSQVVPPYDGYATGVIHYREAMSQYFPNEPHGFISLEGFIVASIFTEALTMVGRHFSTEELVDALERINDLDLGIGATVSFSLSNHQASHRVWGSVINASGGFEALELVSSHTATTQ